MQKTSSRHLLMHVIAGYDHRQEKPITYIILLLLLPINKYIFMLGELNETQIFNVLSSQALGRLACTDGLQPYIVPLTYHFNGSHIYGQTKEGTKLNILRKNPNVCFETDVMTDMANWKCVLVFGKFEELDETESQNAREILFDSLYSLMTSSTLHAHEHAVNSVADDSNRVKPVMFRITIEKMTGRYESR